METPSTFGFKSATMKIVRNRLGTILILLIVGMMLDTVSCWAPASLPKGAIGNIGVYNYSPSVIETEGKRQVWWCSQGVNPADYSQNSDAIYYEWIDTTTLQTHGPVLVLAETPGAWDSAFTCNPKVIAGVFQNPLGDGQTYTYAMYYVGTALLSGLTNSIGVAFSNDGVRWSKYPQPVIPPSSQNGYGVGQPSLYNADHRSAISMFYEGSDPTSHHIAAVSNDGVHFTVQGPLTTNGLDADDPQATWGDISYEPEGAEWYAVFNRPLRPPTVTGGVLERGQYGIELYKIPQDALLTGATSWQQLVTMDTNTTGFESNFIAGFVHDPYGNLDLATQSKIEVYASISYPPTNWEATPEEAGASADVGKWILMPMEWSPDISAIVPLSRYFNGSAHEVTIGWVSLDGGFQLESILGHLYTNPQKGAVVPFYGCKAGRTDYFVSLDIGCEGQRILGGNGYAYAQPVSGLNLVSLYRCSTGWDHFVSKDPKCEGQKTDMLLGYVLP
jgi:hypothetical protein